ncbi:MAG: SEC-C metal-binding domain-containing protein [bacterium]
MTISDIEEKKAEERKREKRLVHFANTLGRAFSSSFKSKSQKTKSLAGYLTKSFLDYIFFYQHKEIAELNENHVRHFLLDFAPQKLEISKESTKEVEDILNSLTDFLNTEGYIKNGEKIKKSIAENIKNFGKLLPAKKSTPVQTKNKPVISEKITVGRNDPCPCGSGKKYKKCCGRNK